MPLDPEWPEAPAAVAPPSSPELQQPIAHKLSENPPWTGRDVLRIALLLFVVPYILLPVVALIVQKSFYRSVAITDVAQKPWIALGVQFCWYLVVLAYMIMFVEGRLHQRFWPAIRWEWPKKYWPALVALGAALVSLQGLERFFHLPKHVPMEEFLKTPLAAILTGIFAISLGPLMEELFFRGFLYPVIARRYGVFVSVVCTSVAFGAIHGAQLAFAWGLVLIIFVVGIVLTIVRAWSGSVASSFVVHVAYNGTLVIMGAIASRHGLK